MLLEEAKQILNKNGFICEAVNTNDLSEGDKFLLWHAGTYRDMPVGVITLIEPDENVSRADKGKAWICELQKASFGDVEYFVGKKTAYTHGTYGDAVIYPVLKYKHTYELTNDTEEVSLKFLGDEVLFKTNQKNHAFKAEGGDKHYYIDQDLNKLYGDWWEEGTAQGITEPKAIQKILSENPELRKEYESMKHEYISLRDK